MMLACMEPVLRGAVQCDLKKQNFACCLHNGREGFSAIHTFCQKFPKKIFLVVSVNVRKPTLHKRKALHHELTGFLDNPGLGGVSWDKISTFSEWGCFAKLGKFASSATKDTPLQIMIELSYFFLDQWEVEIHLLHWASRPMTASNTKRSF